MREILMLITIFIIILGVSWFIGEFGVEGEKVWSKYTGRLEFIDVETDTCCHCDTRIKLYNQSWIRTFNCDESLEEIKLNETYTFYTEPYAEPLAASVGMVWVEVVYRVIDVNDTVVWESHWW